MKNYLYETHRHVVNEPIEKLYKEAYEQSYSDDQQELFAAVADVRSKLAATYDHAKVLAEHLNKVMDKLVTADFNMELGGTFWTRLNSQGELQANGPTMDVLVATLQQSVDRLNRARTKQSKLHFKGAK